MEDGGDFALFGDKCCAAAMVTVLTRKQRQRPLRFRNSSQSASGGAVASYKEIAGNDQWKIAAPGVD